MVGVSGDKIDDDEDVDDYHDSTESKMWQDSCHIKIGLETPTHMGRLFQ